MANEIKEKIKGFWDSLRREAEDARISSAGREKIVVLIISLVLALVLWIIVNLNRDYTLKVQVPIVLGNVSTNQALAEELPPHVTASVNGDGWSLIKVYNNPPKVYINVTKKEVNLFEQIRQQMNSIPKITVQKVEPLYLQLKLGEKRTKKVPVVAKAKVHFANQYGFLSKPVITPDSITIRGAATQIENITQWPTDSLVFDNVKKNIDTQINLKKPNSLITLSDTKVTYAASVTQFTEGQATVSVDTRNFPAGSSISFSPSSVTLRYRIPVNKYATFHNRNLFSVYVDYMQLQQDTTGFVMPHVEPLLDDAHARMRSMQPREVAYFTIVGKQ